MTSALVVPIFDKRNNKVIWFAYSGGFKTRFNQAFSGDPYTWQANGEVQILLPLPLPFTGLGHI